jgi:FtsP/CotA-like multicopper oxidase with cupredoxin domain
VKQGERVLFHIVNASATDIHSLHLPGHVFRVVALDGNAVPHEATVPVLWIAPGERISAVVDMTTPGVWAMGELDRQMRNSGMGIVVEYARDDNSAPTWANPAPFLWDYRLFARPDAIPTAPDELLDLLIGTRYQSRGGFSEFTLNGKIFSMDSMEPLFHLQHGRRYRLKLRNATDDTHPIHIHRNSFEITSFSGKPTAGVIKDVIMVGPYREVIVDFTATARGLSLLHCHMQHHMDYGFMALLQCD